MTYIGALLIAGALQALGVGVEDGRWVGGSNVFFLVINIMAVMSTVTLRHVRMGALTHARTQMLAIR